MAPFYGWGSSASRLEPLQGLSLLFTTKNLPLKIYLYFQMLVYQEGFGDMSLNSAGSIQGC